MPLNGKSLASDIEFNSKLNTHGRVFAIFTPILVLKDPYEIQFGICFFIAFFSP